MIGIIASRSGDDRIVFEVNPERVLTFKGLKRTSDVRFALRDVLGRKPVSQYIGPALERVTLQIRLYRQRGIDPHTEVERLRRMMSDGAILTVVVGTRPLGLGGWRLASIGAAYNLVDNSGRLHGCDLNITLEEYV